MLLVVVIAALFLITKADGDPGDPDPGTTTTSDLVTPSVTPPVAFIINDFETTALKNRLRETQKQNAHLKRQLARVKKHLKKVWKPTVDYAINLASAVTGVSRSELRAVASCESGFYPFAKNGKYKGVFQLGWSPFGFSPYDPIANALSAAMTVNHDGSWRQWECKP